MISLTQKILDDMDAQAGIATSAPTEPVKQPTEISVLSEAQKILKSKLINALSVGVWIVEFEKVDGTKAVMECTRDPKLIDQSQAPQYGGTSNRKEPEHLIPVYALDRQGWRSFRVANVVRFYSKPENL